MNTKEDKMFYFKVLKNGFIKVYDRNMIRTAILFNTKIQYDGLKKDGGIEV